MKNISILLTTILVWHTNITAQVNISVGNPVTQNFDGMTGSISASLPTGWKADMQGTIRAPGAYGPAGTITTQAGSANMSVSAGAGIYNFGSSIVTSDRCVGGLAGGSSTRTVNIYVDLLNNGTVPISGFVISYDVEKYRMGLNSAGFTVQLYYSTTGSSPWSIANTNFQTSFTSDGIDMGYNPAPGSGTTKSVSSQTLTLSNPVPANSHLYLAWSYSLTSGFVLSGGAQALGIDNVYIEAIPVLSASILNNFGNICINSNSASNSFTLSGTKLDGTNVTVGPLAGYTFSTSATGPYSNQLSLPYSNSSFNTSVYVRFSPTSVQSYNGNIPVSGGGVGLINVTVSGSGTNTAATTTTGSASSITTTTVTLNGNMTDVGCSAVTSYGIEYSTANGFANGSGTAVASSNLSSGIFSSGISGLSPGTTYYYHSYAINNGGTRYGSQQSFSTSAPVAVTATPADFIASLSFSANWNVVAGAANYRLDVATTNDFSSGFADRYNDMSVNGTSLFVTGLSPHTTYYYRLRANYGTVTGPNSNVITATTTNPESPLPASLLRFTGIRKDNKNMLTWITATEMNNKGFELQRSPDGVIYNPISFIASLAPGGNSTKQLQYTYNDCVYMSSQQYYYRLQQLDFDGKSALSNIVMIRDEEFKNLIVELYPNPASSSLKVLINSAGKDKLTFYITDMAGKKIKQGTLEAGGNVFSIDISVLSTGMYYLRCIGTSGTVFVRKFIVR